MKVILVSLVRGLQLDVFHQGKLVNLFNCCITSCYCFIRSIFHEVKRYEQEKHISNKSTYWLIFELMWRDFFRYLCAKYGNNIFFEGGAIGKSVTWKQDKDLVERWKLGFTGIPLVDANMRELLRTGEIQSSAIANPC